MNNLLAVQIYFGARSARASGMAEAAVSSDPTLLVAEIRPLVSPPRDWPICFKESKTLKRFLGKALKGSRVRLVSSSCDDTDMSAYGTWQEVVGFSVAESESHPGVYVATPLRWREHPKTGTWFVAEGAMGAQQVLVESAVSPAAASAATKSGAKAATTAEATGADSTPPIAAAPVDVSEAEGNAQTSAPAAASSPGPAAPKPKSPSDAALEAAKERTENSLRSKFTWDEWRADADREVEQSMSLLRTLLGKKQLFELTKQALVNDGHCSKEAPKATFVALAFEQIYTARLTTLVQEKGNFWGGRDADPSSACASELAHGLLTEEGAQKLRTDGLVVIDNAISAAQAAAARTEMRALDADGQLKEVESQATSRVRNDRIGWIGATTADGAASSDVPALLIVTRLLRAMPAEVQRLCGAGWELTVPKKLMCAVYDGSPSKPTYYMKHFDGGGKGNPRKLTAILCTPHATSLEAARSPSAARGVQGSVRTRSPPTRTSSPPLNVAPHRVCARAPGRLSSVTQISTRRHGTQKKTEAACVHGRAVANHQWRLSQSPADSSSLTPSP